MVKMRYKLNEVEAVFKYGPSNVDDSKLACIDIKKYILTLKVK